ncbi:MAG: TetR/AcrR family transcriptional regulator [Acidobacteriaceae bacterium]|nr:TetR/AcrR family transcriptional regulator [Acidobacteriaceae bacterium]
MASLPQPPSPGEPVSSHDRILNSAKQLFASRGYENTSTVAIARMAGTSESQLMKHFGSKEGLLEAIFDQGWSRMASMLRSIHDLESPADKLDSLLGLVLNGLERDAQLKELLLLEGRRVRKEGRMVMLTKGYQEFVSLIDSVLMEMRAAGQLRADANPQVVRSAFMGMFEGLMRDQILAQRVGYPAGYSTQEIRGMLSTVMEALKPR